MFITSRDKIDYIYASLQAYFNIEDYRELNKYLGIELDISQDGSIHIIKSYLSQRIINMIPGMENSSNKPNPAVKPTLAKNKGDIA